jgi:hypothetical protein
MTDPGLMRMSKEVAIALWSLGAACILAFGAVLLTAH